MKALTINILKKCTIFNHLEPPVISFRPNLLYYSDKIQKLGDRLSNILFDFLLDKQEAKSRRQNITVRLGFTRLAIQLIFAKATSYGSIIINAMNVAEGTKIFRDKMAACTDHKMSQRVSCYLASSESK